MTVFCRRDVFGNLIFSHIDDVADFIKQILKFITPKNLSGLPAVETGSKISCRIKLVQPANTAASNALPLLRAKRERMRGGCTRRLHAVRLSKFIPGTRFV